MKAFIRLFFIAALASLAFACTKTETEATIQKQEVSFAIKANSQDTKSGLSFNNGSYTTYFQKGDELGVLFDLPSAGNLSSDATFKNTENDGEAASFSGTATLDDGEGIVFYSYYPASAGAKVYSSNDVVTLGLDVPNEQTPIYHNTYGYSFDPKSDVLIGQKTTCMVVDKEAIQEVDMYFKRLTAVLRIALKADGESEVAGERISSLKIETSNGDIAGRIAYNPETGEYVKTNNRTNSKQIIASFDPNEVAVYIDADGTYAQMNNVFLSVAPVTIASGSTLTFTIETVGLDGKASHKIVKTVPSSPEIAFTSSEPTVITLTIKDTEIEGGNTGDAEWELVTDASVLTSGDKLVIASNAKGKVANNTLNEYFGEADATFTSDKTGISSLPNNALILTLGGSNGAWTLANSDGDLLGATAAKKLSFSSGTKTWSISIADGNATIQNGTQSYGRILHNVTNTRFTTYTSNTSASMLLPQLYRKPGAPDTRTAVEMSFNPVNPEAITLGDSFTEPVLTVTPSNAPISYSIETDPAGIATIDASTGELNIIGTGTITVTAAVTNITTFKPASASYTLTVNPATHGSVDEPTNPDDIANVIENLEANVPTSDFYYVGGTVSAASPKLYNGGKLSFVFGTETVSIKAYDCLNINGAEFNAVTDVKVGDQVVVYGNLEKYVNSSNITTYEVINCQLAKLTPASGGDDVTKGSAWASGDFTATSDIADAIDGVTISSSIAPTSCETASPSRGLAWSSGKSPVLTLSGYTGGIETVTVVMSTNGGSTSVNVAAGGTTLNSQSVTSGTSAANTAYTFTFSSLKTGNVTINVTNTSNKSVWIKSISIN